MKIGATLRAQNDIKGDDIKGAPTVLKIKNIENKNNELLKFSLYKIDGPVKFIGIVPYNITSPIIFKILSCRHWEKAIVMVQDEVADRIVASPNTKAYGRLSVMLQPLSIPKKNGIKILMMLNTMYLFQLVSKLPAL